MRLTSSVLALLVIAALARPAFAGSAEEVCPLMMGKLAIQYEMETLEDRVAARKGEPAPQRGTPTKRGESMVTRAYGMTRAALNKKWPGFYDWATLQAADGIEKLYKPDQFKELAIANCLAEYS